MKTKPPKLTLTHHSYDDWDFSGSGWTITAADFVSPPSSLSCAPPAPDYGLRILCKHPSCLQLPQGMLETYFKHSQGVCRTRIFFRNTAPPGAANMDNTYDIVIVPDVPAIMIEEWKLGGFSRSWLIDSQPINYAQWVHWRLMWWLSWGIMQVRLMEEVAGVWTQRGSDKSIENALFGDETYQRPGIELNREGTTGPVLADDTAIYSPS